MNGTAPKRLLVGSQRVPVTNPQASCLKIGQACLVVKYAIRARIASTDSPAPSAAARHEWAPQTSFAGRRDETYSSGTPAESIVAIFLRGGNLQLGQLI